MKLKFVSVIVAMLFVSFAPAAASANIVDVTYRVRGAPGTWFYDFSVTNNESNDIFISRFLVSGIPGVPVPVSLWQNIIPGETFWCFIDCSSTLALKLVSGATLRNTFTVFDNHVSPFAGSSVPFFIELSESNDPAGRFEFQGTAFLDPAPVPLPPAILNALGLLAFLVFKPVRRRLWGRA